MERLPSFRLSFQRRVLSGLGFLVIGVSAGVGSLQAGGELMGTKFALLGAEIRGDAAAQASHQRTLDEQRLRILVDVVSAAACVGLGARMARGMEGLWSGEVYGQSTAAIPPAMEQPLSAGSNVVYVDFGQSAA